MSAKTAQQILDAHIDAITAQRDSAIARVAALTADRDRLREALGEFQQAIARYLADPLRKKTCAHAEVFIELLGERATTALASPTASEAGNEDRSHG